MVSLLKVKDLNVKYESNHILKDISFELGYMKTMILYSGVYTGSSTFLKALSGILEEAKGEVYLEGKNLLEIPYLIRSEFAQKISIVHESHGIIHELNVMDNILLPCKKIGFYDQSFLNNLIDDFQLNKYINCHFDDLNDVLIRKVNIVRCLIGRPKLILLDEIDNGIRDCDLNELLKIIKKYQKLLNFSTIITTTKEPGYTPYENGYEYYSLLEDGFKKL